MRRKDREMDEKFGKSIIDKSKYGTVSMIDENGEPHGLPLSIARKENNLYFHSARSGEKVDIFEKSPKVSITFVGEINVPEIYTKEELDEIVKEESNAALLTKNVFTTEFESAIITGQVKKIEDEEEKITALRVICEKYTPTKMDYFETALKVGLQRTNIYKIEIETITSKRKKYDLNGVEIKSKN